MAKAIIYSDEDVLAAQQALRSRTARKVGKTRSQVAEFLADDIRKAIEQGYSLKDIKNILAEAGISVSVAKMQAILKGNGMRDEKVPYPGPWAPGPLREGVLPHICSALP